MADNVTLNPGVGGAVIATDKIGGVDHQRMKVGHGVDGSYGDATRVNPLPVDQTPAANCNNTDVASSASSVLLLAANAGRKGYSIRNDSTQTLYTARGEAATTSHADRIVPGDQVDFIPADYTGDIYGIWSSANGFARIAELT